MRAFPLRASDARAQAVGEGELFLGGEAEPREHQHAARLQQMEAAAGDRFVLQRRAVGVHDLADVRLDGLARQTRHGMASRWLA